eukprot:11932269-Prorocentrum_lima.AAC.1
MEDISNKAAEHLHEEQWKAPAESHTDEYDSPLLPEPPRFETGEFIMQDICIRRCSTQNTEITRP